MDNSIEFDLILKLLSDDLNDISSNAFNFKNINWGKWIELLKIHGIFSQVYRSLKLRNAESIPPDVLKILKENYLKNISTNMGLCHGLENFQDELIREGIESVFFKGPVTSIYAYNDYALRSYQDIDILVRRKDFKRLYKFIVKKEFRIFFPMSGIVRFFWSFFGREYTFANGEKIFDLHFRIQRGPEFFRFRRKLFPQVIELEIEKSVIKGISPEMSVVAICINAMKDGWTRLVHLFDLINIIKNNPGIDFKKIETTADDLKVRSMLFIAAGLSERLFNTGLTLPISSKGINKKRVEILTDECEENLREGYRIGKRNSYMRLEMRAVDTAWGRFRYLLYYMFVPKMSDVQKMGRFSFLFPLLILFRPFFLITRISRKNIHTGKKE